MKKLHPSVRQWALSFLVMDAVFLAFALGSCVLNPVECLETFTFGPYLFYLPVSLLLDAASPALTWLSTVPFPAMVALLMALGASSHALVGGGIGWLLRDRKVSWIVSVIVAIVLTVGISYGLVMEEARKEMQRETTTSLLEIVEPTADAFSYRSVTITGDTPDTLDVMVDAGEGWQRLENTSRTKVQVICNVEACADVAVNGYVEIGWDAYVAAHNACKADPTTCPYYSIGAFDLFDVMMDPEGVIVMTERYTP